MSPTPAKLNPFPGLRPFTQEEDYLFFGREEQTLELLQRLGGNHFVAVVGTSGSGKSSLVRCGLLSELLGGRMLDAGASWEIAVTHPGGNPLALLTDALLEADLYDREVENVRENLLATLSRSHFGLVEAVKQADLGEGTNFLIVVDQFEEIFRFNEAGQKQQEAANEFVSLLLEASAQKEVPIYVVLTMRSDFIGECGQFEGLAEMVNRGEFLIPRLTREQYKRVIEGPIKVAGGQIAPRLLQRLLNDLGQQADQLPCLQHALMRTWDVWATKGDTDALDLDDYQRVGKMSQALSLHADEIYESLASDRQRELCKGVFQALTVEESNSRGIRRPQRLGRLCQILEVPADELQPIIDAYRQSGVTFLMPSPDVALSEQTIIDISHESLMRVWTRLRQWVEEETQAAGIYHRLSESADLHAQGKAGLFRDPELGIALAWRQSKHPNAAWAERYRPGFDTAIGFLEESHRVSVAEEQAREAARKRELAQAQQLAEAQQLRLEQQNRAALKLRKMIGGLAVVALIAGFACIVALFANQRANRLAETAKQNEEQAKKNASRAELSQQETAKALAVVESQKTTVESSLTKAKLAEQAARTAEETGRKVLYTTDMRLAPFVWRDDRTTAEQLRVLLAKHTPVDQRTDLRGFEWRYYRYLLDRSGAMVAGHEGSVVDGAIDPNGQLVTLDEDGQLRRWNLGTQEEEQAGHREIPNAVGADARAMSPNGRLVAIATGNVVQVYETSTGKQTFQIASTPYGLSRGLTFSGDGDKLVVLDEKIRWCNSVTGEVVGTVDQKYSRFAGLTTSADGLTLAVVGHADTGHLISSFRLDPATQKVTPLASGVGFGGTLGASAMSPDGQRIAVGAKLSGSLYVIDTATGRPLAMHGAAHASPLTTVAFMGDGTKLATADAEGTIKIWADVRKLTSRSSASLTLKGHQGGINSIGFSSDGLRLVTTSKDQTARVWDLENAGSAIQPLELPAGYDSYVTRFSPDGLLIASAVPTRSASVHLWDASTGKIVRELSSTDKGRAYSVAFSPTDRRLLAVGYGGFSDVSHVVLWDIDSGTELARLPGATDLAGFTMGPSNGVVGALAFSPDGKHLVAGFGSKQMLMGGNFPTPLKVWDVASRRLIRRLHGHTNYCVALNFSPDGTLLASGGRDGTAILWSTATWKAQQTLQNPDTDTLYPAMKQPGMVDDVAFSPDGKMLAMASRERNVQLFDVASGRHLETLTGHSSTVRSVVFAPDGRTLVSGGGDQTVRLWNVETRLELMQLDSGSIALGDVGSLAFSPDGTRLLAGGDGTAIWSTASPLWNEPDLGANTLELLLKSNVDFQSRIRMLSENLRLHAALEKLDVKDPRVAAALAATQANWHASRQAWPEAAAAFDRLVAADPHAAAGWLRTPGLLRLATALLHQDRPRDAAMLLTGGDKSRKQDGLPTATDKVSLGMSFSIVDSNAVVQGLTPGSPAAKSGLLRGDIVEKVDDIDLSNVSYEKFLELLAGEAGTKARLTVRRAGHDKPLSIEVNRERFFNDAATAELLNPLRTAINERLAKEPRNPGWLELRAELAGQWSDAAAQLADYSAAIAALSQQPPETAAADLSRLYVRRANTHLAQRNWQQAADDYARVVTDATTDETLLANQAAALAEVILAAPRWTVFKPVEAKSELGATLTVLPDDSILASGQNPLDDRYRIALTLPNDINLAAVRLEALTHDSLPLKGPGRHPTGTYAQTNWKVTATPPDGKEAIAFAFDNAWVDQKFQYPISVHGHLNIFGGAQANHTAVWSMANPIPLVAGTKLTVEIQFKSEAKNSENLGHFRLALSSDPAAIDREGKYVAATKWTDPWQRLAAAYQFQNDQPAIDRLVERRPKLAGLIGDAFIQDQDQNWSRAVEIYSRGITAETTDADLLSKRARAYEALKNWEAAAADWSRAATGNLPGAKLLAAFAQRLAAGGQIKLANDQFELAQAGYEKSLQADADNDVAAGELGQLLLDKHENGNNVNWTVLQPTELKSNLGATLTPQADGSLLASGINTNGDIYKIPVVGTLDRIVAVRLEALPDPSLPNKGPGRDSTGNFHLQAFRLYQETGDAGSGLEPVPIGSAWASYGWTAPDVDIAGTIDESLKKFWHVWGRLGQAHQAEFRLKEPVHGKDRKFVIELHQGLNLGRFRLSVSSDAASLEVRESRFAALNVTDPWLRLAAAYAVSGRNDQAAQFFVGTIERADGYEARRPIIERADGYEARRPIIELVAKFDEVLALVARRRPADPQLQLTLARKLAERGRQHLNKKQPAEAQAELQKSRDVFTRLRTTAPQSTWTVPTPMEMKSKGGEKFAFEKDGCIFVSGPNPKRAIYSLKLPTDLKTLAAIRLETIPDPRLPDGGAGRFGNGNFHVAEFNAAIVSGKAGGKSSPIKFSSALADVPLNNSNVVPVSIDGNPRTWWDTYPKTKESHWAVFGLKSPVKPDDGVLTITLDSGITSWGEHGLGHFRISLTDDPEALNRTRSRTDLKDSEIAELSVTLAKAHAEQGHVNEAVAALTEALALATDRTVKANIITQAASLTGVLEQLARSATQDGQFQTELARHFAEQGNMALADTARTKARVLLEQQLAKEPENAILAADLADLLLLDTAHWTVLKPIDMKSEGGATLTALPDNSILAGGKNPLGDAYTIVAEAAATRANLIRLEALTHESLPNQGPGRDEKRDLGNFAMTTFEIHQPDAGAGPAPINLSEATSDFGNVSISHWNGGGGGSKPHTAHYRIEPPVDFARQSKLEFLMKFSNNAEWPLQNLGRFRLSVGEDATPFGQRRNRLAAIKITDPWSRLGAACALNGRIDAAVTYFGKALKAADGHEARKAIIEYALPYDDLVIALGKQHPNEPQLQLAMARSLTARGKTAFAADKADAALAELKQAQDIYTRLLPTVADWTVLTPVELKSENGSKLELQKDGSIFVDKPEKNDDYTLVFQTDVKGITGLRLEALTDSRLPNKGPGWAASDGGNFVVSELSLQAAPAKGAAQSHTISLRNPSADFSQGGWNVRQAIDGNTGTGWAINPGNGKDHTALFELAEVVGDGQAWRLTVRIIQKHGDPNFLLGRFRLSVTNDAVTLQTTRIRVDLKNNELIELYTALGQAYVQLGNSDESSAAIIQLLGRTKDRTARANILASAIRMPGLVEKLGEAFPDDGQIQAELAKHLTAQGNAPLAEAARKKAHALFEQQLTANPDNADAALGLGDLLLIDSTRWTVLTPVEMQTETGLKLETQPDGSIFVGQPTVNDTYTLKFKTDLKGIRSLRLEALTDPRLPNHGPGLSPNNGNFVLSELTLETAPVNSPDQPKPIAFKNADADYNQVQSGGFHARGAVDGNKDSGWAIYPETGKNHVAIFETAEEVGDGQPLWLTIRLAHLSIYDRHMLGRFRLSVSDDPDTFARQQSLYAAMMQTDPWAKLATAYLTAGDADRAADLLATAIKKQETAPWLEGGWLGDGLLAALQARHPQQYAILLPNTASASVERGQIDQARTLYERLVKEQPANQLWKERISQLQPGVFAVWNFDAGTGSWGTPLDCELSTKDGVVTVRRTGGDPHFQSPAVGPAGGKAVVLRYRTDKDFSLQLFWDDTTGGFSDVRHWDYPVPASAGQWREVTLPFLCDGTLQNLRLDPNIATEQSLEIDSILLRQLDTAEYQKVAAEALIEPELARLTSAVKVDSPTAASFASRANFLMRLGRWREAALNLEQERKLSEPDRMKWTRVAVGRILADDTEGYQEHCKAMIEQFRGSTNPEVADSVCKSCLLSLGAIDLSELPVQFLRDSTNDPKLDKAVYHWLVASCALISYREGKPEDAIAWSKKHPDLKGQNGALALVVRAMAEHQLGQNEEARKTLAQAAAIIPSALRTLGTDEYNGPLPVAPEIVAHDWLIPEILSREADTLINPKPEQ